MLARNLLFKSGLQNLVKASTKHQSSSKLFNTLRKQFSILNNKNRSHYKKFTSSSSSVLCQKSFSTQISNPRQTERLVQCVTNQIQYENQEYQPIQDTEAFLQKSGFNLIDNEGEIVVTLQKTVGDKHVKVIFDGRSPTPGDDEEKQNQQSQQQGDQGFNQPDMGDYCDFIVTIANVGQKKGLCLDLSSVSSQISINYVSMVQNVDDCRKGIFYGAASGSSNKSYPGPEFNTLDERFQVAVQNYLTSLSINEQLATFVQLYSLDKDQRLYMKWLQDVKDFVGQKKD